MIDGAVVFHTDNFKESPNGWAAIGTSSFDYAQFDNFAVNSSRAYCPRVGLLFVTSLTYSGALPCASPAAGQSVVVSSHSANKVLVL